MTDKKVVRSFTTDCAGTKITNKVTFDFSAVPMETILEWATSTLVIARQRVYRSMKVEEVKKCDGEVIDAREAGKKSPVDVMAESKKRFEGMTPEERAMYLKSLGVDNAQIMAITGIDVEIEEEMDAAE